MSNSWVFQANPKSYLVDEALEELDEQTWLVQKLGDKIKEGDEVFIWKCGPEAALVATGTVQCDPAPMEVKPEERKFEKEPLKFNGKRLRVRVKTKRLSPPITKISLRTNPILKSWNMVRGIQGTNFILLPENEVAIRKLLPQQ